MKWVFWVAIIFMQKSLAHSDKNRVVLWLLRGSSAREIQNIVKWRQRFSKLERQCWLETKRGHFPKACYQLNREEYRWGIISLQEKKEREGALDLNCQKFVTRSRHLSNEIYDFSLKILSKKCSLLVKEKKSRLEYMYGDTQSDRSRFNPRIH